jgi:hypothetical protein
MRYIQDKYLPNYLEIDGNYLDKINYIYTEVNSNYLYKDCSLINDIDDYLSKFNFERVETSMTKFEWGDALYVKPLESNKIDNRIIDN